VSVQESKDLYEIVSEISKSVDYTTL